MSMQFFKSAFNWAERRAVPIHISRSETGNWFVRMGFHDYHGDFGASVFAFEPHKRVKDKPAESDEDFDKRVAKALDDACVKARRDRLIEINRCDPRQNRAA